MSKKWLLKQSRAYFWILKPCLLSIEHVLSGWKLIINERDTKVKHIHFLVLTSPLWFDSGRYYDKPLKTVTDVKSVNLQYITLGCLDDGTNESSTKSLIF